MASGMLKMWKQIRGAIMHILIELPSWFAKEYRQVANISRTLVGNEIVDHSDVVGASPVGGAPTTS